jgi:hypothetical protein
MPLLSFIFSRAFPKRLFDRSQKGVLGAVLQARCSLGPAGGLPTVCPFRVAKAARAPIFLLEFQNLHRALGILPKPQLVVALKGKIVIFLRGALSKDRVAVVINKVVV